MNFATCTENDKIGQLEFSYILIYAKIISKDLLLILVSKVLKAL